MTKQTLEQEMRFLVPLPPLDPPRKLSGFSIVSRTPQKAETFYFDTTDEELSGKKRTLRIRNFMGNWMADLKSETSDADTNLETTVMLKKEDAESILSGEARIQDFFEDPSLLPTAPCAVVGHLVTYRLAIRYRRGTEEVEVAFDECWDDLPIGPFHVAEIENKGTTTDSFGQIVACFTKLLPVIPTSLSKYLIVRKRQRGEPIQEKLDLENGVKETIRVIRTLLKTGESGPIVIFVGGGSASGKTELVAKKICEEVRGAKLLSMDDCFYGPAWMKENNRKNWDDPSAMDIPLFRQWILDLLDDKSVAKKVYSFGKGPDGTETIDPPKVLIVEGIHALCETFDDIPGLRIFVDATTHCRFIRRMYRDALKRRTNQTPQEVFRMFFQHVEPSHQQWIEPTKRKAHIIVENTYDPLHEAFAIGKQDLQLKIQRHVPESLLTSLGAKLEKDEVQFDMYFAPPLQNIWKRGEILRIRRNGTGPNDLSLTYKASLPSGIVRFDMPITPEEFRLFQNHYLPILLIRKHRKAFVLWGIAINLDTVENLGEWTEFCANDSKQETALKQLMELLNQDPTSATNQTYFSMLLAKNPAP